MKNQFKKSTEIFNDFLVEMVSNAANQIAVLTSETLVDAIKTCSKDYQKSKKFYTLTEIAREYNISKPKIYQFINDGILSSYQIKGSSKKYLRSEDVDQLFERVDISPPEDKYESFEREFRLSIKRGKELRELLKEYQLTDNKKSISDFTFWLWKKGYRKDILKGLVIPDL